MTICPGLFHPANMADGLLVRLRLFLPEITTKTAHLIAKLASEHSQDQIELTRRGNMQFRGLTPTSAQKLAFGLSSLPFMATSAEQEQRFDLLTEPNLMSFENKAHKLTQNLAQAITQAQDIQHLSPKFSIIVASHNSPLFNLPYDLGLMIPASSQDNTIGISLLGKTTHLSIEEDACIKLVLAMLKQQAAQGASHRLRHETGLSENPKAWLLALAKRANISLIASPLILKPQKKPTYGLHRPNPNLIQLHLPLALGQLNAPQLLWLADTLVPFHHTALSVSPWGGMMIHSASMTLNEASKLLTESLDQGFEDPDLYNRITVKACVGAKGCTRTGADCRNDALSFIKSLKETSHQANAWPQSVHFSGCAKGCADRGHNELLLLGSLGKTTYQALPNERADTQTQATPFANLSNEQKSLLLQLEKAGKLV